MAGVRLELSRFCCSQGLGACSEPAWLHRMYPYWVTSSMVDGAGEACRRGQAVDWNAVRQSQLANVEHCKAAGESGSSHNFGGGSSAGGGGIGGSW